MERMEQYVATHKLAEIDCDWNGWILPGVLLRITQQAATEHCMGLGLDQAFYQANQAVFLMAKMAFVWNQVPRCGQTIHLVTKPEMARRATYKRITTITDEQGTVLGLVDSRWVLVDLQSHRILRKAPEAFQSLGFADSVEEQLSMQMQKAALLQTAGVARASYTYCDINGHMNNSRYADIACDALPQELLRRAPITHMTISYHNELKAGMECAVQLGELETGDWYVTGTNENGCCFEVNLGF